MSNIIQLQDFGLLDRHGVPMVSSRAVAEKFGKRHDDVLKSIRNLDCSDEFRLRNFADSSYKNEQMELEKKQLRIELIGSGACTAEGFETIWNIIRRGQQ